MGWSESNESNDSIRIDRRLMTWWKWRAYDARGRGLEWRRDLKWDWSVIGTRINNRNRQWRRRGIATGGERWSTQIVWDKRTFLSGNKSVKMQLDSDELKG